MPSHSRISGAEAREFKILRKRACLAQGGLCFWCGEVMDDVLNGRRQCTGDHIVPLCDGGRTRPGNVVAACAKCNNERHPEFNSVGVGIVATTGETATSPFASLGLLIVNQN